jgi:hypothetical protein
MGWRKKMIIGLSGYARSGKDTVADYLIKHNEFIKMSFAAPMKEAMYRLNPIVKVDEISSLRYKNIVDVYGLDKAKESVPEIRRLLQVFGTEVGRDLFGENFWVDIVLNNIKNEKVVISDVRFKNEADAIRSKGGKIWRIIRKDVGPVTGHPSETDLDNYKFDNTLINNHGVLELNSIINEIIKENN